MQSKLGVQYAVFLRKISLLPTVELFQRCIPAHIAAHHLQHIFVFQLQWHCTHFCIKMGTTRCFLVWSGVSNLDVDSGATYCSLTPSPAQLRPLTQVGRQQNHLLGRCSTLYGVSLIIDLKISNFYLCWQYWQCTSCRESFFSCVELPFNHAWNSGMPCEELHFISRHRVPVQAHLALSR